MSLRINSQDGTHYAVLDDTPEGVRVDIYLYRDGVLAKRIDEWLLDCVWHVAVDGVERIMWNIDAGVTAEERHAEALRNLKRK